MKAILLFLFLLVYGCSSYRTEEKVPPLTIVEVNPDKWTAITKQNLLHLTQVYDLSPFLYTKELQIDPKAVPHSHPVLTLNTRHAENPKKILSALLHEELHWWLIQNQQNTNLAVSELRKILPGHPESTHLELIISYLEERAMEYYLGNKGAKEVITSLMKKDKVRPWVYYQILYNDFAIKNVVKKYNLLPPHLT